MTNKSFRLMAAAVCVAMPTTLLAEGDVVYSDLGAMAAALGVSETQTQACMPAPLETHVDVHPDLSDITTCLQEEVSTLTSTQVNDAWLAYGPKA